MFESLDRGTFSFTEFYSRRIRRIFPALLLVLIASYAFGWFSLLDDEYKQLGKHIAAGAGFVANFALWGEAGYFDNTAETKPLLHLWSLGVEEQFYIIWPVLLWLAWSRKFNLLSITIFVALVSFYLNVKGVKGDPVATFYSPQTRFWELMSGSILAWVKLYKPKIFSHPRVVASALTLDGWLASVIYNQKPEADGKTLRNVVSFLGLFLLVYGFCRINKEVHFPGNWALVPVLSAVIIISSGPKAWVNRAILSNKAAVWLGLISYPLYLWHWPLLSFSRIIASQLPGNKSAAVIVALSMLLAWLTYRFVELPIRFGDRKRTKVVALVALMLIVGCAGYDTYHRNGLPFRTVAINGALMKTGEDGGFGDVVVNECGEVSEALRTGGFGVCLKDKRGPSRFALLGDSKAGALMHGLIRTSTEKGRWVVIGGNGKLGTPEPLISNDKLYKDYQPMIIPAVNAIAKNNEVEKVVIAAASRILFHLANDSDIEDMPATQNYQVALDGLKATVSALVSAGKKVVLLVDNPTLPHPEDCLYRETEIPLINHILVHENPKCILTISKQKMLSQRYLDLLHEIQKAFPNDVKLFDPMPYLCDMDAGVCTHRKNGRFLYGLSDHISDYASGLVGKELNAFVASY